MRISSLLKIALLSLSIFAIAACTKSGGGKSDSGSNNGGNNNGNGSGVAQSFSSDCGTVINSAVKNPVTTNDGTEIDVLDVFGTNLLSIRTIDSAGITSGPLLLKLHGIGSGPITRREAAQQMILELTNGKNFLFKPDANCQVTLSDGGRGTVGQLFNKNGANIGEELVRAGLADVEPADVCNGALISACLNALKNTEELTAGELDEFLWKPQSDSDGNLAVHTGPVRTTVIVNGEVGANQGGGNGYGSLARFSRPGCNYTAPSIEVIDEDSGLSYSVGGKTVFTVPNPCGRNCLQGGQIVACAK